MVERNIPYDMMNMMILKEILSTTTFNQGEWSAPMPACKQVPCPPIISLVRKKITPESLFWLRDFVFSYHDHQVRDPLVRVTETHHGMKTLNKMMQLVESCIIKVMMMLMMTMKMVLTKSK